VRIFFPQGFLQAAVLFYLITYLVTYSTRWNLQRRHSQHLRDPRCEKMDQNQDQTSMKRSRRRDGQDNRLAKVAKNGRPNISRPPKRRCESWTSTSRENGQTFG